MENRKIATVLLFLCALTLGSQAVLCLAQASAPGFSLQQVLGSPFPTNLVGASQSSRIAWIFNTKGEHNVWVADAPDFEARQDRGLCAGYRSK